MCNSTLKLTLDQNGKCVCDASNGYVVGATGACVKYTAKCPIACGSNGACQLLTPTTSGCVCKNGFITTNETKPCSSCPQGKINSSSKCVCDTVNGYTINGTGCGCDASRGYIAGSDGLCSCNANLNLVTYGSSCVCKLNYHLVNGSCVLIPPACYGSSSCGIHGQCMYEDVNNTARTICQCDTGYTTASYSTSLCVDCARDYRMDKNYICKKSCVLDGYNDDCTTYVPADICAYTNPQTIPFCGFNIYRVRQRRFLRQNYTGELVYIGRDMVKDLDKSMIYYDTLAKNKTRDAMLELAKAGVVCDSKCKEHLTVLYCKSLVPMCDGTDAPIERTFCKQTCIDIWSQKLNYTVNLESKCEGLSVEDSCDSRPYINPSTQCFGVHYLNSSVCSGRGQCIQKDTCNCNNGYGGKNCEQFVCFIYKDTDIPVCNYRGKCVGPHTCACNGPWTGSDCQIPLCNRKTEKQGGCNFNGVCKLILGSPSCICASSGNWAKSDVSCSVCATGWGGPGCNVPVCNGVISTSPDVCGGRGGCDSIRLAQPSCTCLKGYEGNNCQNFKCNEIDRNSTSVCSGRGTCAGLNTCVCKGNFDPAKFCSECTPAYNGTDCTERVCTEAGTCNGNGICNSNGKCDCTGNWVGQFCDKCLPGFVGSSCNIKCDCNGRGSCNNDGSCICSENAEGTKCETCKTGWYGDKCDFSIDASSFGFSSNGDSISGTVYSSLKRKFDCSELILESSKLGKGAVCVVNSDSNLMTISLGRNASIVLDEVLTFKSYFNSSSTVSVTFAERDYIPTNPSISVTTDKTTISRACGFVYLDASGSTSTDRRTLQFSWSVQSAPSPLNGLTLTSLITNQQGSSGVTINSNSLGVGSYSVTATITSPFSGLSASSTVSFLVTDLTAPIVSIKEGSESTMTIGKIYSINPKITFPSCYGGNGPFTFTYALDVRNVIPVVVKQKYNILVFSEDYTKITEPGDYYFTFTVSQAGASSVTVPFKVTAKALPLSVGFNIGDRTQSVETEVSFTVSKSDPSNPSDNSGTVVLSCLDLDNSADCSGFTSGEANIDQTTLKFSKFMVPGPYLFTATFTKGSRSSSASIKVTVIDQPKDTVIRVSIAAPPNTDLTAVDPSSDFILQAYSSDVLSTDRVYTWSSPDLDMSGIVTSNKYILLPKILLVPGTFHIINLNVVDDQRSGEATISFTINSPPTVGILEVSPATGVALQDDFQIKCGNGWYDTQLPLMYEFKYRVVGDSTWKVLSEMSEKKSITSQLPAGKIEIKTIVYDSLSASSETTTLVTVTVPSLSEAIAALNVSQMGTVSVASVSSALSLVSEITVSTPEQKQALAQANKALVDKFFEQQDVQSQIVSETSQSASSKVSVISSISNCLGNFPDETISKVIDQFSSTISSASSSSNVNMKTDDIQNSKEAALNLKSYVSNAISKRAVTTLTVKDLAKIDGIYSNIVNVELKSAVADMPAVRSTGVDSSIYARLVSISTLSGLSGFVDDTSFSSSYFEMKNVFSSMKRFENVDSVKIVTKVYKLTNSTLKAISKVIDFVITENDNNLSFASENITLATIKIEKVKTARTSFTQTQISCYSVQNNVYSISPNCKVVSTNSATADISVTNTGSYVVAEVTVDSPITPTNSTPKPTESNNNNIVTPIPGVNQSDSNLYYIIFVLAIIPIVLLIIVGILVCICCMIKKKKKRPSPGPRDIELTA
ncbi:predicted protein [Naegleria gruberi]|uniref:Predicted protein n=1 Tax=Naegleria gruberi TaxID=5762 RepID=D2W4W5_NAEGR|nr:uncharacterized protein NAEGRDRAFT_76453 [Naegleria gruberi]EFC35887.1 predicted protein [Naegleria gruberi]|eukprot:XP_002668631.1 predicted protein [Naegleria gruberi strain NEG-M]